MNVILDILFPKKCVGCNKTGSYFCEVCKSNILQTDLVCPFCEKLAVGGQTHPICRRKYGLDGLWSLGIYKEPLRSAIQTLKYKRIKELSEILVDVNLEYWAIFQPFVLDQIKKDLGKGWIVVPVPLHWYRQNERGFNQSSLMGKMLAEKLGLKYCEAIKRLRFTKSQVKLKGKQRRQNIKNAFELTNSYNSSSLSRFGLSLTVEDLRAEGLQTTPYVLLLDDVWTTGSTLKECCYVLKRNGAKKVWALTLAR